MILGSLGGKGANQGGREGGEAHFGLCVACCPLRSKATQPDLGWHTARALLGLDPQRPSLPMNAHN